MPSFKNLAELEKYINEQASKILKTKVAEVVTQEMSDTIKEVEYPKYESDAKDPYIRRMDDGGLSDVRTMQVEVLDDNTIQITSENMDGDRNVAEIFATGIGYNWQKSEIYKMQPFPRDFYADTVERLLQTNEHVEAFKNGMRALGFSVK